MRNSVTRWSIYLIALFIAGPAAGALVGSVRATDGGPASPLVSAAPMTGLAFALIALFIALAIGIIAAKLLGTGAGMTAAGVVVAWTAWRTADVDQLIRTAHSGSPLTRLAIEGVVFGIAGLLVTFACWTFGRLRDGRAPRPADGPAPLAQVKKLLSSKAGMLSVLVGIVVGGVAAWLIAATPLKGQAVFAAIAAGAFAAAAVRLVDFEAPIPAMFLPILLLAVIGPLTGLMLAGSGGVLATSYKGALFPLANISPLDWIAGGLLGIPLGISWAGSMIEKRTQEA